MRNDLGSLANRVMIILAAVLLMTVSMTGTYYWQKRTVDNLKTDVANLQTELATARQQADEAQTGVTTYESARGVSIKVYSPRSGETVRGPLIVMGEVPGNWSFEASFPAQLLNAQNEIVAEGAAQVLGEWMTEELVPFRIVLNYSSDQTGNGTLVLRKDNPSDLPENADTLTIPITF